MNPNRSIPPSVLTLTGVIGFLLGFALQLLIVNSGYPLLLPAWLSLAMVAAIAAVILILGLRVRAAIASKERTVNPFAALRLLAAARCAQLAGIGFAAAHLATALLLLLRPVGVGITQWSAVLAAILVYTALAVVGIIVERFCKLPPIDTDELPPLDEEPAAA